MNQLKRIFALGLAGCLLLLAACGGGGASQSGAGEGIQGRYIESDITPPGYGGQSLQSFVTQGGALVCFTEDLTRRFDSADGGESWTESDGPGAGGDLGAVRRFTLLPDGDVLAALADDGAGYTVNRLVRLSADGTETPYPLAPLDEAIESEKNIYLGRMQVLSGDRLFVNFNYDDYPMGEFDEDGPQEEDEGDGEALDSPVAESAETSTAVPKEAGQNDGEEEDGNDSDDGFFYGGQENFVGLIDLASGEVIAEYPDWYGVGAAAYGDTLYLLDYQGDVETKSLRDGSATTGFEAAVPLGDFVFNLGMTVTGPDELYVVDGKRLQKVSPDGQSETLLDGGGYTFGDTGMMTQDMHVLENGAIVMNLYHENGAQLLKYEWDPDAVIDADSILNIWSLNESTLLRAAISQFRKQNPDVLVQYEVALDGTGGLTAEDAIKNLNTRLLNGTGPDLMLLDGTPMESYADKGVLQDLSGLIDTDGMFANLRDAFTGDGGTFYLPTAFKIPLLISDKDNLAAAGTLADLVSLVQSGPGLPAVGEDDDVFADLPKEQRPLLAFENLREAFNALWQSSASAVVGDEGLDSDAARTFLKALSDISDHYNLPEGGVQSGALGVSSTDGSISMVQGSILAYSSQRGLAGRYLAEDIQMLEYMTEVPGSEMAAFPGLVQGAWQPLSIVGISADSPKTELAASFLQAMLGVDVQAVHTGNSFPITKDGFEKQIAVIDELMQEYTDDRFTFDYQPLVNLAQQPCLVDEVVTEMVWQAAEKLCNGETDLEGAVNEMEQSLKNYLAERL